MLIKKSGSAGFGGYDMVENALTDEDIPWFLTEASLDNDPAVFITALGHVVRHKGIAQLAEQTGLNRESLHKTFNGKVQPRWILFTDC
ncbi:MULTISPECIES: addiction module antidote protein [unclassified Endozoicomonas]|uniref:addiction module antidote protein n=1 Tax=unclassified Endozoicomonas TaxID=2644528 RepID=UPI003BB71B74